MAADNADKVHGADTETPALIALSTVQGLGPSRIRRLVDYFGSARRALKASVNELQCVSGVGAIIASEIARMDSRSVTNEQLRRARRTGALMLRRQEDRYPPLLKEIHDPPPFLWCVGEPGNLDHCVAVIGTRTPSDYGRRAARHLTAGLVQAGYVIVSGLAYGIDAVAHRTALEAGGRTLAVLGSGVDVIYPAPHRALFKQITSRGAVLSEFPLGATPDAVNFPRRNRLISGMSVGVVLVEAREKGGGLITARQALEQNREVFCVPGSIFHPANVGTNRLIRDGEAKLVSDVSDVLAELQPGPAVSSVPANDVPDPPLNPVEREIVILLSDGPMHVDAIVAASHALPSEVVPLLLSLEIKGWIAQGPGMVFYLVRGSTTTSPNLT